MLFITDVYFPRVNGVSTSIRTFRQDLAACGIETLLIAPRYTPSGSPDEPGVVRVEASGVPIDPEDRRMRWSDLTRTLARVGRSVDLVHIHTPFLAHYAGSRFARSAKIPCVATYHTFFEEYLHHYVPALPRRLGGFLARSFTRSQCDDVQALIAPSDPMRQVLLAYGVRTPIHVIPTGLPPDRFQAGDAQRFRAQAGLPRERPLVTYIGRVAHEKNIDFLVDVFVEVRRSMPAMLVIAGEGPAREPLRRRIAQLGLQDDVHFAGYLDRNTALLDCYAAADVFVFASRTETQGLVLLEAMAQGAPVVSTAELGTRSILESGRGALVVEERVPDFAAAVLRVLHDARLREELASAGRANARAWSSAATAARLAGLYRSLSLRPANAPAQIAPDGACD